MGTLQGFPSPEKARTIVQSTIATTSTLTARADRYRRLAAADPGPLALAYRRRAAELELRAHVVDQILHPVDELAQAA